MEIFDNKKIGRSELVISEFRNHTLMLHENTNDLNYQISETIIKLVTDEVSFSIEDLRSIIIKKNIISEIDRDYYHSKISDIYSQYQMICNNEVRKKLGLKFAIYQGGIRTDSRSFCVERNRKCYSENEIEQWKYLEFSGKPERYNPFYDCGGINCVHRLDWISEEFAKRLRPDLF